MTDFVDRFPLCLVVTIIVSIWETAVIEEADDRAGVLQFGRRQ